MTSAKQFRGIFGIPATPFLPDESIDWKSLERVLHFTVEAGCHGMTIPVMASEVHALLDDERRRIAETAVRVVNGRIPVVVGVSGVSTAHSVGLAKHAQDVGADAVIAVPPHGRPPSKDEVVRFFHELGSALTIPVFVQNHNAGYPMDAATLAQLCREAPNVRYVKEETMYAGQVASKLLELAGDACQGVMGGKSGLYLINEFKRGESGNMPASHFGDAHSDIWNRLERGDEAGAREVHRRLLPLITFENLYGVSAFKEVLRRRGVIDHAVVRSPGKRELDPVDADELITLLAEVGDLLTWKA